RSSAHTEVEDGKVVQSSPRASRLNLDNSCSLIINNITADDAGRYVCRPGSENTFDGLVFLNVLTISDADSTNEDFTLQCSLWRDEEFTSCPEKSFRWFDETGSELTGENVGYNLRRTRVCVSSLTVKNQSDTNRRFTCQLVEGNEVKVEVQYTQVHLYHRAGDEAVLPCNRPSSSDSCSSVDWIYQSNEDMIRKQEVHRGMVQSSPRSARMSLDRKCSLIINNITAEDVGRYSCGYNTDVYLNMMIISLTDSDPTKNEEITLFCSLLTFRSSGFCPDKSFLWLDETGSELTGEGDGYKYGGQFGCVSSLTVNLQSSRRFTCQFVEGNKVKIEAHYGSEGPPASSPLSFIMLTLKITGLILMVGITVGIIRTRGRKKPQKDVNVRFAVDDDSVNYENDGERSAAAALH
ncbi:twitchin-like, partial [Gambusia affinis]|uniref:twitchin-like n=1 Tax=Gambusia affinis TaxID=33528 RepID=UPI001CDC2FB7